MSKFIVRGGLKLEGEIKVKGAKNAALKILPASILSKKTISISNLPNIEDINRSLELLEDIGATIIRKAGSCEITVADGIKSELDPKFANKFRASIMYVGPILARTGKIRFPHPGGCVLGAAQRPIDLFLEGFKAMGASVEWKDGFYDLQAERLKGCEYFFTTVSVTGTESLMMTSVLSEGKTTLKNCAMEPEIGALADYLNKCGAKISGAGTPTIIIEGVKELGADKFTIIPDRIETGTFAILAAATKSQIKISDCEPEHIESLLSIFKKQGIDFETGEDWILMKPSEKIKPYSVQTHEYPGFPTDLQSPYTVLMTQAEGSSLIHETIYDRRLLFSDMLTQMGADIIMCDPHRIVVNGPAKLFGRKLASPDLRAGIAIIIAALVADGTTEIENIYQIDRGYENIDERLRGLGADIKRIGTLNL